MSKAKPLTDIVAKLLQSVDETEVTVDNIEEVVQEAENAVRTAARAPDDIEHRIYVPSKTLPVVEIVGEPIGALAQVRSIRRKDKEGRWMQIVGKGADADYALYLCQIVDKAVRATWEKFSETDAVKSLPNSVKSTYRRTYQREVCGTIRNKLAALNADRLFKMDAKARMELAQKRDALFTADVGDVTSRSGN